MDIRIKLPIFCNKCGSQNHQLKSTGKTPHRRGYYKYLKHSSFSNRI